MNAVADGAMLASAADCAAALAALRLAGAERFDPVRWHFIAALARRAAQQPARVRQILQPRLAAALADLQQDFEQAQGAAWDVAAGDRHEQGSGLAELVRHIEQQCAPATDAAAPGAARAELKAARHFGITWSKLSAARQLSHAIEQAPQNAGPLNSQFLVLRSLEIMRNISPDYLNRFMSYVDTLLCLDQAAAADKPAAVKKPKPAKPRAAKR